MKKQYETEKAKYKKLKKEVAAEGKHRKGKYETSVKELRAQLQERNKEVERMRGEFEQEKEWVKQSQRMNEDYLIEQNSKLENKLSFVQKELAESLEKNSRLEDALLEKDKDAQNRVEECENKLNKEIDSLKTKFSKSNISSEGLNQHRDQRLASSIQEECHKLNLLYENIHPATRFSGGGKSAPKSGTLSCKRSLVDLQDAVELVCRGTNDLVCEVTRLRRERSSSSYRSSAASASAKQLKSSRERFGSYDTLLKSYDFDSRSSKQDHNNAWNRCDQLKMKDESNTVKLLSRLQGRVKQLRTDNATSGYHHSTTKTP